MRAGSVIALVKTVRRFADMGSGIDFPSARLSEFQCSAPIQRFYCRSSIFPSAVYRPWLPQVYKHRSIHSTQFSEQTVPEESENLNPSDANPVPNYLPTPAEGQRPRVVVLGTGWAGCRLIKELDPKLYDIVCVSPRNHMVFTPLLASTSVGTLEFRSVAESVRTIQPALAKEPNSYFFLARCTEIDTDRRRIRCQAVGKEETEDMSSSGEFSIAYDKLVIALGAQSLTFNIPGVHGHAIFLREVGDAQKIRSKLLLNLAISDVPGVTEEEKRKILQCVVVGGGPTGVEFSGELSDFIRRDVIQKFSHVKNYIHVTLIESGVKLVKGVVKEVHPGKLVLSDGNEVPYGLLVWSTGVGPSDFVKSLSVQKSPGGRIGVDEHLRVAGCEDVYAIGDCSGYLESTGKQVLPALAQVAERQGKYLAKALNSLAKQGGGHAGPSVEKDIGKAFVYRHLGSMATVGHYKALVDLRESKASKGLSMAGFSSWIIWRSAYLTRVISWRNRIYVALNWATTFTFGRDISRF